MTITIIRLPKELQQDQDFIDALVNDYNTAKTTLILSEYLTSRAELLCQYSTVCKVPAGTQPKVVEIMLDKSGKATIMNK